MKQTVRFLVALVAGLLIGYGVPRLRAWLQPPAPVSTELVFRETKARQAVPCPAAGPRTMVALVVGQSHSGNYVGERYTGAPGTFQVLDGRCYPARDPALGAGGVAGNVWTLAANDLVAAGVYGAVVISNVARGNAKAVRWADGGDLVKDLEDGMRLPDGLAFTHVFMTQGVADRVEKTPAADFTQNYGSLITRVKRSVPGAPIFVSFEVGYCNYGDTSEFDPEDPISKAVRALPDPARGVFPGADMDRVVLVGDRYDGCHSSASGARKLASEWVRIIRDHR